VVAEGRAQLRGDFPDEVVAAFAAKYHGWDVGLTYVSSGGRILFEAPVDRVAAGRNRPVASPCLLALHGPSADRWDDHNRALSCGNAVRMQPSMVHPKRVFRCDICAGNQQIRWLIICSGLPAGRAFVGAPRRSDAG
jgi:hypothetical protein